MKCIDRIIDKMAIVRKKIIEKDHLVFVDYINKEIDRINEEYKIKEEKNYQCYHYLKN